MAEYSEVWTDSVAAEFAALDPNSDGFLTVDEVLRAQKR